MRIFFCSFKEWLRGLPKTRPSSLFMLIGWSWISVTSLMISPCIGVWWRARNPTFSISAREPHSVSWAAYVIVLLLWKLPLLCAAKEFSYAKGPEDRNRFVLEVCHFVFQFFLTLFIKIWSGEIILFHVFLLWDVWKVQVSWDVMSCLLVNPLNTELNPIRHLLALVGACHIVHVSRIRVNGY